MTPEVPTTGPAGDGRRLEPLTWQESIKLLGTVSYGRIVFTSRALPAVRPVNHLIDEGDIIIRTHLGSAITGAARTEAVVAYEADCIDPDDHVGWSVVVTGLAGQIIEPGAVARYQRLLRPWINGPKESVIRVMPELVTGYRLVPASAATRAGDYPMPGDPTGGGDPAPGDYPMPGEPTPGAGPAPAMGSDSIA